MTLELDGVAYAVGAQTWIHPTDLTLTKGTMNVLLDEPLANLDYKLREELRAEIPRIFAESGSICV